MVCIPPDLKCKKPVDIEFGKVSTLEGLNFDATATYGCEQGYELVGPEERTCQGDLKWSGDEPICLEEGSSCSSPSYDVPNATLVTAEEKTEFLVGDYAVYKCDEGFYPEGPISEIECVTTGPKKADWSPLNMTCLPNPCQMLDPIENGSVTEEKNFTFGDTATYQCDQGFTMVGEPDMECQADGTWLGEKPTCELPDVNCPIPPDPENGVIYFEPELRGHLIQYKCDPGYKINGSESRQCVNDGEWSGNDTYCSEIDCGEPEEPVNGTIIFLSGTTWSKQVDYACNEDATPSGASSAECLETEQWSNPPPICLSHCIITKIDNGFFVQEGVSDYSSYNMIPLDILLPHNTSAQIACEENYEMPSNEPFKQNHGDIECTNGTWAPSSECVPARCFCEDLNTEKLFERNFSLARDCFEPTPHGQEVSIKCLPEFPEIVKKGTLKCDTGEWQYPTDPDERCTKKSCSVKDIKLDNGKIYKDGDEVQVPIMADLSSVPHGTELKFECDQEGFELYVDKMPVNDPGSGVNFTMRDCENGVWSGRMPVCRPARCLCTNLTANLTDKGLEAQACQELASSGDLIKLSCAANFSNPTGPLIAECNSGEWKPLSTECKQMCSCEDLRANLSTSLKVTCEGGIDSGTTLDVECARGYVNLTGTPSVQCMEGLWLMNETYCNATDDLSLDEGLMRPCTYISPSNQLQAFFQGKAILDRAPIPHMGNLSFRCTNVQSMKFTGSRRIQCIDGKFAEPLPECMALSPNNKTSAPPLWLMTFPQGIIRTNEEGVIVIKRDTTVSITCWYMQMKPQMLATGELELKSQRKTSHAYQEGWTTAFEKISDILKFKFSCTVPGAEIGGPLSHEIEVLISDTCILDEDKVRRFGFEVDPASRRYLYVEEDRVNIICDPTLSEQYFPYIVCKAAGRWDFAPEVPCPEIQTTPADS